jgi:hypothetical protein
MYGWSEKFLQKGIFLPHPRLSRRTTHHYYSPPLPLQEHFGCFDCAKAFANGGEGGGQLKAYSYEGTPYCEEDYRKRVAKKVRVVLEHAYRACVLEHVL